MSNKPITIKRLYLDHVLSHDEVLYNTNNHWDDKEVLRPDDYDKVVALGNTRHWIDMFHANGYHKITLDRRDLKWMNKAAKIGMITDRLSHIYDDEFEETCKKYEDQVPPGNYFIRTDKVSLKYGKHGVGPYNNIQHIIESMVTSTTGHLCFHDDDESCDIYFMKWQDINDDKEFRIFVHENEITAISQQHLYSINEWLNGLTDDEIKNKVQKILEHFDKEIRDKMRYMGSYVMDLALVGDDEVPYFIEPNSFGKLYASGSALYQWIYDHDTLYDPETVEFRYVNEY